jgi:hypothetical protein
MFRRKNIKIYEIGGSMDITLNQITEYISKFVDYINNFTLDSRERDNAISKLEEAVFWITYLNEEGE